MALSPRQKVFFFVGLNIALYGLSLTVLGIWHLSVTLHGAAGASAWAGIVLIMCGVGNIITSIDSDDKDNVGGFSIGAIIANLIALFFGIAIIGFASWAAEDDLTEGVNYAVSGTLTEIDIDLYVSVALLGTFSMILALIGLLFECCCNNMDNALNVFDGNPYPGQGYPSQGAYAYPQRYR